MQLIPLCHEISCGRPLSFAIRSWLEDHRPVEEEVIGGWDAGIQGWTSPELPQGLKVHWHWDYREGNDTCESRRESRPLSWPALVNADGRIRVYVSEREREIDLKRSRWNGGSGSGLLSYRLTQGSLFISFNFFSIRFHDQ